jgi:integrase
LLLKTKQPKHDFSNSYIQSLEFLKVSAFGSDYESIDRLLKHLGRKTGSKGTERGYLNRIHVFCLYLNLNPDELIALPKRQIEEFVQTYADGYNDGTYSQAYINNNVLAPLRTLFKVNGFKGSNVIDVEGYYVPPRYRKTFEYVPTKYEIYCMADNAGSLKGRAIILILYSSGLRPSTLRALLYRDVKDELSKDLYNIKIPVYPEMKLVDPGACKNNIPYYTFSSDEATIALRLYVRERIEKYGTIGDNEPIFSSEYKLIPRIERKNKILCPRQLQDIVKIPAKKVIPQKGQFVSPRSIRKACESVLHGELVEGGHLDPKVQEFFIGHMLPGSQDNYFDEDKIEDLRTEYSKLNFGRATVDNKFKVLKQAVAKAFQGTGLDPEEVMKEYMQMKQNRQ